MSAQPLHYLTIEEYLEIEEKAEYKSEYYKGRMWPLGGEPHGMAGGRTEHGLIAMNAGGELRSALKGRCHVFSSDVLFGAGGLLTYPDVSVVCGKPELSANKMMLLNPIVIVEVLSKTTEANDRGLKFAQYQLIASLQEYVLISQTEARVEVFRRGGEDGAWILHIYTGLEKDVVLDSVGCSIPLREIYSGVEFDPLSTA